MSKAFCGIGNIPKGQKKGSMKECVEKGQVRLYGLFKIDPKLLEADTKGGKKEKKIKARDALRLPKDHPAHIQAAKIAGPDDAPANEPKKAEPGKAATQAAKPAEPGQPTKQGQTAQGKIDKEKSLYSSLDNNFFNNDETIQPNLFCRSTTILSIRDGHIISCV